MQKKQSDTLSTLEYFTKGKGKTVTNVDDEF